MQLCGLTTKQEEVGWCEVGAASQPTGRPKWRGSPCLADDAAEPYYRAAAATLAARLTAAERAKVVFKRPGGSAAAMCKPVQAERGIVLLLYIVATAACCSGTGRPMLRSPQCSCCFREVRGGNGWNGHDFVCLLACHSSTIVDADGHLLRDFEERRKWKHRRWLETVRFNAYLACTSGLPMHLV